MSREANKMAEILVDSHCHVQDERLNEHIDEVIARALKAGVTKIICNGTSEEDWQVVADMAERFPEIVPCFGLHPWHVKERGELWLDKLETMLTGTPGIAGIGEIGLDRWIDDRDEPAMEECFRAQLSLARKLNLPVTIHCLRAWGWLQDVLADEPPLPRGFLLHGFGGPAEMIKPMLDSGAWFSVAGSVFRKNRHRSREAVKQIPLDRLLLETDAPDIPPPKHLRLPGLDVLNEPANLSLFISPLAEILELSEDVLSQQLLENALAFWGDEFIPALNPR